ncbi:hypothetical protein NLG97_g2212 [Lecanicillium saksenae]|uniref:Uncharacterized protein n=1 Tax=Lecanicillium saksenae TaxID=468837 RepID=A0ACC1R3B0_9HYPO|nr:hypothetical protein NLG97_g2212 [Lecanicillium saksenae]
MVYALSDKLGIPNITDKQYLDAFEEGAVTALVPFFLNVANPDKFAPMLSEVQKRNITIVPGIGKAPDAIGDMDAPEYLAMAKAVKKNTDYVRIENMQGFYDMYGKAGMQNFMDYCKGLGYKHIMMNPWPKAENGSLVIFDCPQCNSAFNSVVAKRKPDGSLKPDPDNWHVSIKAIDQVRAIVPNIPVLINYESPGPQKILSDMEQSKKGSSLDAFKTTVGDITGRYKSYDLHWSPPLTQSYDSIDLETWDWIANELKTINPSAK